MSQGSIMTQATGLCYMIMYIATNSTTIHKQIAIAHGFAVINVHLQLQSK